MTKQEKVAACTAQDIIYHFVRRAYFDGHIVVHEPDVMYKPDIATITRDLRVNEYEIKVSLQDLRKELDYIDFVTKDHQNQIPMEFDNGVHDQRLNEPWEDREKRRAAWMATGHSKYRRDDNKYRKHRYYLFGETPHYMAPDSYRPNRFYFLIPKELYEAEKARIDAIPMYGVIDARTFFSLKRCRQIHQGQVSPRIIWQAALNLSHKVVYDDPNSAAELRHLKQKGQSDE